MKQRPDGFLRADKVPHDSEVFDYIVELHEYLWRIVNVAIPGASGMLDSYLPSAIEAIERLSADYAKSSEQAGAGWQQIETAPKDGTWILVWEINGVNTKFSPADVGRYYLGEWQNGDKVRLHNASHWMPLPAPPAAVSSPVEGK